MKPFAIAKYMHMQLICSLAMKYPDKLLFSCVFFMKVHVIANKEHFKSKQQISFILLNILTVPKVTANPMSCKWPYSNEQKWSKLQNGLKFILKED